MDERHPAAAEAAFRRVAEAPCSSTGVRLWGFGDSGSGLLPVWQSAFTNLAHYVSSGDFVESILRNDADVNDYAFALGAMAYYASDNAGHPLAVNRIVPLMYPKVRAKWDRSPVRGQPDTPCDG